MVQLWHGSECHVTHCSRSGQHFVRQIGATRSSKPLCTISTLVSVCLTAATLLPFFLQGLSLVRYPAPAMQRAVHAFPTSRQRRLEIRLNSRFSPCLLLSRKAVSVRKLYRTATQHHLPTSKAASPQVQRAELSASLATMLQNHVSCVLAQPFTRLSNTTRQTRSAPDLPAFLHFNCRVLLPPNFFFESSSTQDVISQVMLRPR